MRSLPQIQHIEGIMGLRPWQRVAVAFGVLAVDGALWALIAWGVVKVALGGIE